jgi:hypothetical protein
MLEVKKAALLGYGIMSFADLNDMGRGLQVEVKKFNPRVATPAQINALRTAVGGDSNDLTKELTRLNRFSPDHAMFMLVKRKYIDLASLVKDPFSDEFFQVRWTPEARDSTKTDYAHLINGNTRRELCISLGTDAMNKLEAVKTKITDCKDTGREEYHQLLQERTEAATEVRIKTSWIVAFFDQGQSLRLSTWCSDY